MFGSMRSKARASEFATVHVHAGAALAERGKLHNRDETSNPAAAGCSTQRRGSTRHTCREMFVKLCARELLYSWVTSESAGRRCSAPDTIPVGQAPSSLCLTHEQKRILPSLWSYALRTVQHHLELPSGSASASRCSFTLGMPSSPSHVRHAAPKRRISRCHR